MCNKPIIKSNFIDWGIQKKADQDHQHIQNINILSK